MFNYHLPYIQVCVLSLRHQWLEIIMDCYEQDWVEWDVEGVVGATQASSYFLHSDSENSFKFYITRWLLVI